MKTWLRSTAHVAGFWTMAVVQPILDLLGRGPEFFVAQRADPLDAAILAALLTLAPVLVLGLVIGAATLVGRRTSDAVTAITVGALAACVGAQIGYRCGVSGWWSTAAIGVATVPLAAIAWWTLRPLRLTLTVMASAVMIVPLAFLSSGGIRSLSPGAPEAEVLRKPSHLASVVFFVFDELPLLSLLDQHGAIDSVRFPNLAALAADGVWFKNASTVSDFTQRALPAILTGRYPAAKKSPTAADYPHTLLTLLAPTHRVEVFETVTALSRSKAGEARSGQQRLARQLAMLGDVRVVTSHLLLPPDARAGLPEMNQGWAGFDDEDDGSSEVWTNTRKVHARVAAAFAFVDTVARSDQQPALYFMHSLVSHHPPRWIPSGQLIANFVASAGAVRGTLAWGDVEWPIIQSWQGQLLVAGVVDTVVGRLRTRLRAAGLYDRTLVVITADHGISFKPGGRIRDFTPASAAEILPVPLIVKLPSDRQLIPPGTVDSRNVETVDILPTLAEILGIPVPWPVDGTSALRERSARAEKVVFANWVTRLRPDDLARQLAEETSRKAALFGTGPWPMPSPPGLEGLTGRLLESLVITDASPARRLEVDNMFALDNVDLSGPAVPVQIKGRVVADDKRILASTHLVIAVNGRVVATTRTWSEKGTWMALFPPDRLRNGRNDVQVFVVDPAQPARLTRTKVRRSLPASVNLALDGAAEWGVALRNFYPMESAGGKPFRWTREEATIRVPLGPGRSPVRLSVDILFTGAERNRLRIMLNTCELLSETLPAGQWTKTVDLTPCKLRGKFAEFRILSDTHVPGGGDSRRLGVAVANVSFGY